MHLYKLRLKVRKHIQKSLQTHKEKGQKGIRNRQFPFYRIINKRDQECPEQT